MKVLNGIILFGLGAGVGTLVTSLVLKKKHEAELDEIVDMVGNAVEPRKSERTEERDFVAVEDERLIRIKDRYKNITNRYAGKSTVDEEAAEEEATTHPSAKATIYVVSLEEFSEEMAHFDKQTLTYYEDDDVLTDEGDEQISDVDSLVGDALDRFGDGSEDPEVVYVRNVRLSTDFEVIRLSKSYKETVLGNTPTPVPAPPVPMVKKKPGPAKKPRQQSKKNAKGCDFDE